MNTPKENVEMLKEMVGDGYKTTRELADINLRTWNNILDKQIDMFNVWLEAGVKQVELTTSVNDHKEYLSSQTALTKEIGEKLIASGRDAISAGSETQGEYRAWYEKSVQSMSSHWNKAGKQAS